MGAVFGQRAPADRQLRSGAAGPWVRPAKIVLHPNKEWEAKRGEFQTVETVTPACFSWIEPRSVGVVGGECFAPDDGWRILRCPKKLDNVCVHP